MTHRLHLLPLLFAGTVFFVSGCSVAPPMTQQETQIKSDLAVDKFLPATRQMREAIETQELFAQAAFWSNEHHLNPSDLEAALKLSSAVRRLGNPVRAVEITQQTRALYPRDPYLMAEYAAALIASERSVDAIPILNEGLARTPQYGRLWSLKGAALDQQERYTEARQHYDRALRITPNDPNVMANIGLSHALSGDPATAEGWLRRAVNLPNASDNVKQNLILVLELQGKTSEAQSLANYSRPRSQLPTARPAHTPTVEAQTQASLSAPQPQGYQPQARLHTSAPGGQQFKTASDAVRAVAAQRGGQAAVQQAPAAKAYAPQAYAQPAGAPPAAQPAVAAPAGYQPGGYPQGFSAQASRARSQPQERREPNRRRR